MGSYWFNFSQTFKTLPAPEGPFGATRIRLGRTHSTGELWHGCSAAVTHLSPRVPPAHGRDGQGQTGDQRTQSGLATSARAAERLHRGRVLIPQPEMCLMLC